MELSALEVRLRSSHRASVCNRRIDIPRLKLWQREARASYAGQQGVPPRLNTFMSRSIVRPEPLQLPPRGTANLPESFQEHLPADFTEKYYLLRLLGKGSFGTVYSIIDMNTGLEWAAKIMPKHLPGKDPQRILQRLRKEVDILERLRKISETLQLHEVIEDEESLCIITEVCDGGDLEQFLRLRGYLTEAEAARVMHAALVVLEECHRQGIRYGDVKPANFLLKWPFPSVADPQALPDIRVADFGCARVLSPGAANEPGGTPLYMAPEQFMQTNGVENDMWSMGVLLYQLLCGRLPFAGKAPMDIMMSILSEDVKFEGPRWTLISQDARSLIMRMLDRDFNSRVKPGDALTDQWLLRHCWSSAATRKWSQSCDHPPRQCAAAF